MAEHALLVTVAELPQYGMSSAFLDQFVPRVLEVQVTTGGAIGTMAVAWRNRGDASFSASIQSIGSAPWSLVIGEAFATLAFPSGTYVLDEVYTIDAAGAVTGGSQLVTATRYDLRQSVAQSVTDEALGRIYPEYTAPLTSWGSDLRGYVARIIAYELQSIVGMSPSSAALGDENLRQRAHDARATLDLVGKGQIPLQGIVDSSTAIGDGILVDIASDDQRGW